MSIYSLRYINEVYFGDDKISKMQENLSKFRARCFKERGFTKKENTYIPNGLEKDYEKECKRYDEVIESLGEVDLQLLGIGTNGHIGFNEPEKSFTKGTHKVELTEETIKANARFFGNEDLVPKYAYSMGIKNIMNAKQVLLIASGKSKANAVYETLYGDIRPEVPSTILQLHPNVIIIADEDALSVVKEKNLL